MSQRARRLTKAAATLSISPSKSKKKPGSIRKKTSIKKSSPIKHHLESTTSILTQPRQKRLSSLTAAALVQYCTSILSPSRKANHATKSIPKNTKSSHRKRKISNVSLPSEPKNVQTESNTRTRREASSRASAMIMQQNEIERSRYSYSSTHKQSTSIIRRNQSKSRVTIKGDLPSEQPFQFNIPSVPPSITKIANHTEDVPSSNIQIRKSTNQEASITTSLKYPSLTESILAEHDRLHETLPLYHSTKHDNLIKWTRELALCGRLSPHNMSLESIDSQSSAVISHSNIKEKSTSSTTDSILSNALPRSIANNVTAPTFLLPSAGCPLELRSFYPLLPCWQYPAWSYQPLSSNETAVTHCHTVSNSENKRKKSTTFNSKPKAIVAADNNQQDLLFTSPNDALTFHLHTHHHHHHIHNSNSSFTLEALDSTKIAPLSSRKASVNNQEEFVETKIIPPSSVNNVGENGDQPISTTTDYEILNLSTSNPIQQDKTINKTTRRKSSPVKRRIGDGTKTNSASIPSIADKILHTTDSFITSTRKRTDHNQATAVIPVSSILKSNGNSPVGDQQSSRRSAKRRSVSAAAVNSTAIVSITNRSLREKRTTSASSIPIRSKSAINRNRSYSPVSLTLPLSNKRKKQKVSYHWVLCGRSEQKLVSIQADKPPVFRQCYSSIRHITEKDVIKSNDCVLLRPDTGTRDGVTPYLAKVKWFWQEATSDEIQMSLIWYYHPEHTELPARVKERFLPNELLASKYWDCVNVACIEDKCYVLNLNEYNRYCLREESVNLFEHSEPVGQLKSLLNKTTSLIHHRPLPAKTVGNQNIFFCRYVYDYRVKRILKNPSLTNPTTMNPIPATSSM